MHRLVYLCLLAVILALMPLGFALADERPMQNEERVKMRSVTGRVVEKKTRKPLEGVVVTLRGTEQNVTTSPAGTFTLSVPASPDAVLVVAKDNYANETVALLQDQTEVEITLGVERLEEIVVVGRATRSSRRTLANAVATVQSDALASVSAENISVALQGKVAGANIQSNSGAPGGGIQLQLRGISTIIGRSAPLFVLNGVILSDAAIPSGISAVTRSRAGSNSQNTQDDQVNRIADLSPYDIESIQILKGASAAAIYGAKASNGVVIINTKRGEFGAPRIDFVQRVGFYQRSNDLGSRNYETEAEVQAAIDSELLPPEALNDWRQGQTYNHEDLLAGRTDLSTETFVSIHGADAKTDYYGSLFVKDDEAIIRGTGYDKQSALLRLGHQVATGIEVDASAYLIHSTARRGIANNDNAGVSPGITMAGTPNFANWKRRPDGSWPVNSYVSSTNNPLQTAALMKNEEDVWRVIGALNSSVELLNTENHNVRVTANVGVDRFQQENDLFFPPEIHFESADGLSGTSLFATSQSRNINLGLNFIHTWESSDWNTKATTSGGLSLDENKLGIVSLTARDLIGGQENIDYGREIQPSESNLLIRDRGYYLQEDLLLFDEQLSLVGAARIEQSSANGDPDEVFWYPKAAVAYHLPGMPTIVEDAKVRFAYGETGNAPLYGQKFTSLDATERVDDRGAVVVQGIIGSADIRPERQREFETGIDISAWQGRAGLEFTLYQRSISDLLLRRATAPSTGFEAEFFNGGELRNRGIELMLTVTPIRSSVFEWSMQTSFALNRSLIVSLPVPAFNTGGFGTSLGAFRIEEGQSATQVVGNAGPIDPDDPEQGTRVVKLGDTEPDFRVAWFNRLQYKGISLDFLWSWQQGGAVLNVTRYLYDGAGNSADFESRGQRRLQRFQNGYAKPYIEDATFLKLRELSLAFALPETWLATVSSAVRRLRVSLSGRNLLTWSRFSGLDPEVSNFGNQPIARNIDVAPFPPSRSFWLSLDGGF